MIKRADHTLAKIENIPLDRTPRMHLGASEIGNECVRALWYSFRWVSYPQFENRMIRLFNRGHLEETRFIKLFQDIGCTILTEDQSTGEQFTISDFQGHFGGSLDGVVYGVPEYPDEWILAEFKTAGDKSFKILLAQGVEKAQSKHFMQMQTYMHYKGLKHAIYCSVNKNTDELYFEIIDYNSYWLAKIQDNATTAIYSEIIPAKISNNPAFFKCKFCNFYGVCQLGQQPEKNCRTCEHVKMLDDGKWKCGLTNEPKEKKELLNGCNKHKLHRQLVEVVIDIEEV
jgi:hypothetical protein